VEVLIVAALFSLVGGVVLAAFSNGMKVWQKVYHEGTEEKAVIFFDKISSDLRGVFNYRSIKFVGDKDRLQMPTLAVTTSKLTSLKKGVGEVIYYWDKEEKKVLKVIKNMSNIYTGGKGEVKEVLKNVEDFNLNYYFYDKKEKKYRWTEKWRGKVLPIAVSIRISISYNNNFKVFNRTISIPVSS
jgi:hypothetical protein